MQQLDIAALSTKYNIPVRGDVDGDGQSDRDKPMSDAEATELVGSVGAGFTPTSQAPAQESAA
jgi:hypothetical protein